MFSRSFTFTAVSALTASIIVLAASLTVNTWPTSLFRSALALAGGGASGYLFYFIWRLISADFKSRPGQKVDIRSVEGAHLPHEEKRGTGDISNDHDKPRSGQER